MRRRKVAIATSTEEYMDPALIYTATLPLLLVALHAPSTVPTGSAQRRRAPEMQGQEKRCVSSIPPTEWLALLKAAPASLLHEDFA